MSKAVRVSVIDLGGGYSDSDLKRAARCFRYAAPTIDAQTGDGLSGQIRNNNDETELDLQTIAAFAPGSTIQLIEPATGLIPCSMPPPACLATRTAPRITRRSPTVSAPCRSRRGTSA